MLHKRRKTLRLLASIAAIPTVALAAGLSGCDRAESPSTRAVQPAGWQAPAASHHAGAPVSVMAQGVGELVPGEPSTVTLRVAAQDDLATLGVSLRGVDGVVVQHTKPSAWHSVRHAETRSMAADVTVPPGVAGWLAVDISWKRGANAGSITRVFPIRAPGARPKVESLGRIVDDPELGKVEVMRATKPR